MDRYGIPPSGVRDLLVDYLVEIRPGMDYGSVEGLAYRLVRLFWWEMLQINPDQADLRLSPEVATAWRERLAMTTDGRPRRRDSLDPVRDPRLLSRPGRMVPRRPGALGCLGRALSGATRPAARCAKEKRRQKSQMQDRTRMLTPLLPAFVAAANDATTPHRRCSSSEPKPPATVRSLRSTASRSSATAPPEKHTTS